MSFRHIIFIFSVLVLAISDPIEDFSTLNSQKETSLKQGRPATQKLMYSHPYWERFGEFDGASCNVNKKLKKEISSYKSIVDQIMKAAMDGNYKGETYKHLAHFTDNFGSRMPATQFLDKAIGFLSRQFIQIPSLSGSVYSDDVQIPNWIRGNESAEIITPIKKYIQVKGMGLGASTPPEGIEAEVLSVESIEELRLKRSEIPGKIVVLNLNFDESLLPVVPKAAALGAVAVLMRSPTPFSIYSIHATSVIYGDLGRKIPAATITVEDAEFLHRIYKKGKRVTIKLLLESKIGTPQTVVSQNIIVDFEGRQLRDEYIIVSGHSDSWDIGSGASDAASAILTYELARLFDELKLFPKRTVRAAIWTGSKFGNLGVRNFLNIHDVELTSKYSAAMGADLGCMKAVGFIFSGHKDAACVVTEILQLFKGSTGRSLIHVNGTVADVSWFTYPNGGLGARPAGIPSLTLNGDDGHLTWFSDSNADTVSALDSDQLDQCLGIYTSLAYVLADLTDPLPLF